MPARKGPKRPPPPEVNLPIISEYAVEKLANVLRERSQSQRLPDQTARVLVLFVAMWQSTPPMPLCDRKQVANHLGVSVPCVDVALSYRQSTGDISIVYKTTQGNVNGRLHSTVRQRFVVPSDEIRRFVNDAEAVEVEEIRRRLIRAATVDAATAALDAIPAGATKEPYYDLDESTVEPPVGFGFTAVAPPAINSAMGCEVCEDEPARPAAPTKNKRSRKKVAA